MSLGRNTMKGVNKAYNKLLKVNKNRRKVNGLKVRRIEELDNYNDYCFSLTCL